MLAYSLTLFYSCCPLAVSLSSLVQSSCELLLFILMVSAELSMLILRQAGPPLGSQQQAPLLATTWLPASVPLTSYVLFFNTSSFCLPQSNRFSFSSLSLPLTQLARPKKLSLLASSSLATTPVTLPLLTLFSPRRLPSSTARHGSL